MRCALALAAIAASLIAASATAQDRGYDRDYDRDNRGGESRGAQPPRGDYFRTCRNISTYGFGRDATMTAQCRDDGGRWREARVRFAGCERIENRDGELVCRGRRDDEGFRPPGQGFGGPGYGRRSEITLFSAPNFGGEPFRSRDEVTNLPRRFNDQALSLRIEGRGAWQVCSDSDFRGRCQIFNRDVADLRQFGLGYAVTSMRPAR